MKVSLNLRKKKKRENKCCFESLTATVVRESLIA